LARPYPGLALAPVGLAILLALTLPLAGLGQPFDPTLRMSVLLSWLGTPQFGVALGIEGALGVGDALGVGGPRRWGANKFGLPSKSRVPTKSGVPTNWRSIESTLRIEGTLKIESTGLGVICSGRHLGDALQALWGSHPDTLGIRWQALVLLQAQDPSGKQTFV
jgi:hypothetical protein